jgi:hypothetical protein
MTDKTVTIELNIRVAAAVRETLFRTTKEDSYEFPSERTLDIRSVIVALDEQIQATLDG